MKNEIIDDVWNVQRVKELTMHKVQDSMNEIDKSTVCHFRGRFAITAAIVMTIMLTSAITVLAVSGTINFDSIFRSIFENEQAEPYIITEDNIIASVRENDVDVRITSAFYDESWGLFMNLIIHDPTGTQLAQLSEDTLIFYSSYEPTVFANMYIHVADSSLGTGVEVIDNYTLRAGLDHVGHKFTDTGDIVARFNLIASGVSDDGNTEKRPFLTPTGFNPGRNIDLEQPVLLRALPFLEIMEVTLDGSILTIAYRDVEATTYGWSNGLLLLEQRDDRSPIWKIGGYSADDESRSVNIFDLGTTEPENLHLSWMNLRADHLIIGDWEFIIPNDYLIESRTFTGEIDGHNVEMVVSALGTRVYVDDLVEDYEIAQYVQYEWFDDVNTEGALALYLANGTVVEPRLLVAWSGSENRYVLAFEMEFTHPDDIVRVMLLGVEMDR